MKEIYFQGTWIKNYIFGMATPQYAEIKEYVRPRGSYPDGYYVTTEGRIIEYTLAHKIWEVSRPPNSILFIERL